MKQLNFKFYPCLLLLLLILRSSANGANENFPAHHLEDQKFPSEEYEDSEIDERDSPPGNSPFVQYDQILPKETALPYNPQPIQNLNPNIKYDQRWGENLNVRQISAVSIDPKGNIGIFHRGHRVWDASTFSVDNKFDVNQGPIKQSTIMLLDKSGRVLQEWGRAMFYLPHGLTIDSYGNYWITDVAMHQVFKFDVKDIEQYQTKSSYTYDAKPLKPSLSLGEAFQPGNDHYRFCKPTAVAVQSNGDFFVSDGYCNSRIIKFNKNGERIDEWGRTWGFEGRELYKRPPPINAFLVPHALALDEEHGYLYIADRENNRVVCSYATNGTIHKEFKNDQFGGPVYSIAYANNRLYLVNGKRFDNKHVHVRGYVLDVNTGKLLSEFAPNMDMDSPHDIAVSQDEKEIYVVELNIQRVYKFNQDVKTLKIEPKVVQLKNVTEVRSAELLDNGAVVKVPEKSSQKFMVIIAVIFAIVFIGLCIFLAALLAKYQKKGCLYPCCKNRSNYDSGRNDAIKLSSFLEARRRFNFFEKRPNTRDFSKVNTEPETSDEEVGENNTERIV
ncbi:peptidyl-alpha-hydroxyglycine alpha-amidating lyase 1-like [Trichogramma pretiosum]|uniref:peptidyl-alpha-hydroxyglycine alpha-amidating lyase 1-like n=1 Tax=Trichogramma pretiosum TaxID=7493 RepID=UPI0006C9C34B|nr:peptidyl-alpha-hydroxyglycine alpha-amidating lyase 1-like [Trichogramma pretiosum]